MYNTRRSYGGANNAGQRNNLTNNFVDGGQLKSLNTSTPNMGTRQGVRTQEQQKQQMNNQNVQQQQKMQGQQKAPMQNAPQQQKVQGQQQQNVPQGQQQKVPMPQQQKVQGQQQKNIQQGQQQQNIPQGQQQKNIQQGQQQQNIPQGQQQKNIPQGQQQKNISQGQNVSQQQKPQIVHHQQNPQPIKPVLTSNNVPVAPQSFTTPAKTVDLPKPPGVSGDDDGKMDVDLSLQQNTEEIKQKKFPTWKTKSKGKVSKHDKIRKRNQRLRKILQPKNAAMVLNELVGSLMVNVEEKNPMYIPEKAFRATIMYDNIEHEGFGKSKAQAKSAASEAVIRYLFMKRLKKTPAGQGLDMELSDVDGDVKMEEVEEEGDKSLFSWSHIASFALHKLLTNWDDGGTIINAISGNIDKAPTIPVITDKSDKAEMKPAKKLPENAAGMNPIMLIYQMRPGANFEEVSVEGNPPNVVFVFKCVVGGDEFIGRGPNKKTARKIAAYLACQSVLSITYSGEVQAFISSSLI